MSDVRATVDSNILVYACDVDEPEKKTRAVDILRLLLEDVPGRSALTTQVLAEFYNASTKSIRSPISAADAQRQIENFIKVFPVFPVTPFIVMEAIRGVRDHSMSYWDAQIWATAHMHQVPYILSEDFDSGASVEGVRFLNPFSEGFATRDVSFLLTGKSPSKDDC